MKIEIHELATKEFDEAIEWYENQSQGLGKRFRKTVIDQIKKIKKTPTWFLVEADNVYKAYVPKFPYKILFTIGKGSIIIWAIAHMHREPWYWQSRKS
ncbi:MAG: type II toxin-antitoxin system RelE/ParE family toxin [Candidatus Riflebacteria bacterium]|nr:type II toxin-antitoxin system RelE/ParE family toxin [Candidatus Riflebacteria bacterium]